MTHQMPRNQIEDMNDATPSSPDCSNLTTDVGDNPYIRHPHPLKAHLFSQDHRIPLSVTTREKRQNITCDLILNLTQILTSDDLTLLTKKKKIKSGVQTEPI